MDKYIFLDIDGVLATGENLGEDGCWTFTPRCIDNLNKILSVTDAKIVLSSSWRKWSLEDTIKDLKAKGFPFCGHLVGITIRAYQYLDRTKKIHLSIPRGVEIDQWIDTNIHSNNGKDWNRKKLGVDYNYIILDDDYDMLLEQKDNFIHITDNLGLSDIHVQQAINILI